MKLTIFTSMTNPEDRMDPYKEALSCYEDFADEVITVGQDWPEEFSFEYIGTTFQEGFDKSNSDWVIRMDIDNFFHERDILKIRKVLQKHKDKPAIVFPKFQIFTPDRYDIKAKMCIAYNKKQFPNIKLNGGGDLCQPTLDGQQLLHKDFPTAKIPIYQYDSVFRTKEIISHDRARFARAWHRYFKDWGGRGSDDPEEAEMATARASSSKAYKILLQEEVHRRKASKAQREGVEKDEQRVAKITGRKRKYTGPAETLLRADNNESIFKIKVQWKNTKFIDTIYSRDFPSERTWFQGDQLTMLEQKLGQSQSPGEFFQKGGLRNAEFNGFTYNLSRFERDASQLCWFAIYLNLVLEQQPNGEFWGMELFSWGKRVVR